MCDITASTVDLAVRGYLRIEERERTGLAGWLRGNTYSFEPLNYHRRPCKVPSAYVGGGIATTAILLLGLAFWGESFQAFYFPLGAVIMAAVLTAVPIIGFGADGLTVRCLAGCDVRTVV